MIIPENPFPYDHECNPARLFIAIQQRKEITFLHVLVGSESLNPCYMVDGEVIHILPSNADLCWAEQMKVIHSALSNYGYHYNVISDWDSKCGKREAQFSTSNLDWPVVKSYVQIEMI